MNSYSYFARDDLPKEVMVLEELCDREGVLRLRLRTKDNRQVCVVFDDYLAYRKADEGDMLVTLSEIRDTASFGGTLYEVGHSEYLAWFVRQSRSTREASDLRHFAVLSIDDIVDVIAFGPPSVSLDQGDA